MPTLASIKPTEQPKTATKSVSAEPKMAVKKYEGPVTREIIYPHFRVKYHFAGANGANLSEADEWADIPEEFRPGPITEQDAKDMLGWETQKEYTARCLKDESFEAMGTDGQPITDPTESQVKDASLFERDSNIFVIMIDHEGNPVTCWNNNNNRPFREGDCKKYVKTILTKNWAGPIAFPGETVNGETIIISRTANVESGQHRLIALILACQIWRSSPSWQKYWPDGPPVLESLVVYGASDDPRVLMTLDNVIPRDGADTIYTSGVFQDIAHKDRSKMATMLDRAIDIVWRRTGMADQDTSTTNARTNPETMGFLRNHPWLEKAVRRMFEEDKQKGISKLHISPGQCAGLLYLMAASASDPDACTEYVNATPRNEEKLTFQNRDLAIQFWRELVKNNKDGSHPVAQALLQIPVDEDGAMARVTEKHAVICKAWREYLQGNPLTVEVCSLQRHDPLLPDDDYMVDADGAFHLKEEFDFGGPDCGNKPKKIEKALTEEEKEQAVAEERRIQAEKAQASIDRAKKKEQKKEEKGEKKAPIGLPTEATRLISKFNLLKRAHPNCVLLLLTSNGAWAAYDDDATFLSENIKPVLGIKEYEGMRRVDIPPTRLDDIVGQINAKGYQVGLIEKKEGKEIISKIGSPSSKPQKPGLRGGIG